MLFDIDDFDKNDNNSNDNTNNKKIIVLPYIKEISEVAFIVDKSKYITGYITFNNLGGIIRIHKDPKDLMANNHVVYKKDCNASYVGQTKRQLNKNQRTSKEWQFYV